MYRQSGSTAEKWSQKFMAGVRDNMRCEVVAVCTMGLCVGLGLCDRDRDRERGEIGNWSWLRLILVPACKRSNKGQVEVGYE